MIQDENDIINDLLKYIKVEKGNVASMVDLVMYLNSVTHNSKDSDSIISQIMSYELIRDTKQGYILTPAGIKAFQMGIKEFLEEKNELGLLDKTEKEYSIRMNKRFWCINVAQLVLMILSFLTAILGVLIGLQVIRF